MSAFRRRILMQSKDDGEIVGTLLSGVAIRNSGEMYSASNSYIMEFNVEPNTTYTILREAVGASVRIGDYPTKYAGANIVLNNFTGSWTGSTEVVRTTSADARWLYVYPGASVTGIKKGGKAVSEVSEDEQI